MDLIVQIARCPQHGLHGERTECFVCAGPVDQVAMAAPAAVVELVRRSLHRIELQALPGLGERRTVADRNRIPRPASADAVFLDDVWQVLDDVDAQLRNAIEEAQSA